MIGNRLKLLCLFMFSSSSYSLADGYVELVEYQLWSTTNGANTIRVIPTGALVDAQGCSDPDSYMVKTTLEEAAINRIYSSLLTAKMSDKPVKIYIQGCEVNRSAIVNVILI